MAKVTITLTDLEDERVNVSISSEPPVDIQDMEQNTPAQNLIGPILCTLQDNSEPESDDGWEIEEE